MRWFGAELDDDAELHFDQGRLPPADARDRTDQMVAGSHWQDVGHVLQDRRRVRDRIGRKQQVVEPAGEQHFAQGIGVDRALRPMTPPSPVRKKP